MVITLSSQTNGAIRQVVETKQVSMRPPGVAPVIMFIINWNSSVCSSAVKYVFPERTQVFVKSVS